MTNNKTNYMRSVNDYSLSAHEIYNHITGQRFPEFTQVYTFKNIDSANFKHALDTVLQEFYDDDYESRKEFQINYSDGNSAAEENPYTIYEQYFNVLVKKDSPAYPYPGSATHTKVLKETIIIEIYRRNDELVVLTLSGINTQPYMAKVKEYFEENFKPAKHDKVFYTISQSSHGFELEQMNIPTEYDESSIDLLYNDEFKSVHETIVSYIDGNKKGLVLLHGLPGSGKTSYIKQLISKGGTRKLVYIPPHLASSIASPAFISFVRDKLKSCVLVIEDAEEILRDRAGTGDTTAVSNLLNISDGILGEALNILIICTFNVEKEFIDKALLRKGRMICEYYFGELELEKSINLVKSLFGEDAELTIAPDEQRTLANIFNMEFKQHRTKEPKRQFGFVPVK